jgi:hypothetical protein
MAVAPPIALHSPPGIAFPTETDAWTILAPPPGRSEWSLVRPDLRLSVAPERSGKVAVFMLQRLTALETDGVVRARDQKDLLVPDSPSAPLPCPANPSPPSRCARRDS